MQLIPVTASEQRQGLHQNSIHWKVWTPVLFGVGVLCVESTRYFGGNQTQHVLRDLWQAVLGQREIGYLEPVNHYLRKAGHFTGYGTLALLIRRAWAATIGAYLAVAHNLLSLVVAALSVACTYFLGSLDEWHQSFLPGRSSTQLDVLLDTTGALLFNIAFWLVRGYYRKRSEERAERQPTIFLSAGGTERMAA